MALEMSVALSHSGNGSRAAQSPVNRVPGVWLGRGDRDALLTCPFSPAADRLVFASDPAESRGRQGKRGLSTSQVLSGVTPFACHSVTRTDRPEVVSLFREELQQKLHWESVFKPQ